MQHFMMLFAVIKSRLAGDGRECGQQIHTGFRIVLVYLHYRGGNEPIILAAICPSEIAEAHLVVTCHDARGYTPPPAVPIGIIRVFRNRAVILPSILLFKEPKLLVGEVLDELVDSLLREIVPLRDLVLEHVLEPQLQLHGLREAVPRLAED